MKSLIFLGAALAAAFSLRGSDPAADPLPGMPPVLNKRDIYSADAAGDLSPVVKRFPSLVYVPNSGSNTVDVIDPKTFRIVGHFRVGRQPQHVTPSWDLKTLWVLCDLGDSLTLIDPATGKKGETLHVKDPYNMYYTPDGKFAIVVAERIHQLDFRDAQTMKLVKSLPVPCRGVDHMDFSANGRYLIASCEFAGSVDEGGCGVPDGRGHPGSARRQNAAGREALAGWRSFLCRRYGCQWRLPDRRRCT